MQRSLNLHPASAATHGKAGWLRNYMEEPQRAKMHFDTAMRLSPIDIERFRFLSGYAVAHQQLEEHDEGLESADRALELNPNWATAHRAKVVCLVNLGRIEEARQAATLMLEADPKFSVASYSKTSPFRTDVFWSRVLDGLRKAGLPE